MESEIGRLERERRQAQGELAQMVRQLGEGVGTLRQETGNLVTALKRPATRGSWGEIQLRNVVEMAGMVSHCDFLEQSTIQTDEGALRPDMLVRLPGGKLVVVDSKVPLDAYLSALEAPARTSASCTPRATRARRASTSPSSPPRATSASSTRTPEFVVMFVPSDGIYQAALAQDPALIEYGVQQQVLMATPTTLIGLLWAVHYGWRQELIAESAREIAESARELHSRLGRFVEPFVEGRPPARLGRRRLQRGGRLLRPPRDPAGAPHRAGRRGLRARGARAAPRSRSRAQGVTARPEPAATSEPLRRRWRRARRSPRRAGSPPAR